MLLKRLNHKFFYKIFFFMVAVVMLSLITMSSLFYSRFYGVVSRNDMDFVRHAGEQTKNNILNFMGNYEVIAGNIYSDTTVQSLLKYDYTGQMDYALFERFNFINNSFEGIRSNNPNIREISLYKINKQLIMDSRNIKNIADFSKPELMKKAMDAKGQNIWLPYYNEGDKAYRICLMRYINVLDPGGVLAIEFNEQSFYNLYKSDSASKYQLYLVDDDNTIISSSQREKIGQKESEEIRKLLTGSNVVSKTKLQGTPYYAYHDKIKDGLSIVLLYNSFDIENEKRNIGYYFVNLSGIFIIFSLLISLLFSKHFSIQVNVLMEKIKQIEKGNLDIKPSIKQVNEFHMLDKTLSQMANRISILNRDVLDAVKQKDEIEIKYLQMQMNPHFLYNTLSTIRWLAFNEGRNQITYIIDHLSNFYRIGLSKGNDIIDIEAEISLVESYVALQNLCCSNQIRLNINLDEELRGFRLSKMTIQPFVENSIIHGRIQNQLLNISIDIRKAGELVVIEIHDDGSGIKEEYIQYINGINSNQKDNRKSSYGIINTIMRLNIVYKHSAEIQVKNTEPGTCIRVAIKPGIQ